MIVKLKRGIEDKNAKELIKWLENQGLEVQPTIGKTYTILGLVGDTASIAMNSVKAFEVVDSVTRIQEPYKSANKKLHPTPSVVDVGGVKIGGGHFAVMAGPCSVESKEQVLEIARAVKASGANLLRGGAFKPRTSPYSFQGMGNEGIEILLEAKKETGLPIVSEIMDIEDLPFFEEVDMLQVGARNMQNFAMLKKLGQIDKPILLKRGLSATYEEWIMSAEYIMAGGNKNVILCERGIRTFETGIRNVLDITAVPYLREKTHLPIIIDPSHASGMWEMVEPLSIAATAIGADGLLIEVHNDPERALCDGPQSLKPSKFDRLMKEIALVRNTVNEIGEMKSEKSH
ncbi:3-deoxy-7-phosphoheptulonate synthase [Miniphocaeibacter halophilus]|uniref:3-deoxy-7-phosphoheptulonate synthase n=1 Tax=Miniphocaeibacter halophilus TaxID=2931922 RepID=A0AC61MWA3_9FIRM|nr:3-deoxy-7-phosphoheptulonate synthase [Miniphocaeibacter halophilus]QQK08134.1 3-deoxy-7-phosphoheptulonate synthase [Miniphocaeibacter halophilus]